LLNACGLIISDIHRTIVTLRAYVSCFVLSAIIFSVIMGRTVRFIDVLQMYIVHYIMGHVKEVYLSGIEYFAGEGITPNQ
jgi:hypothetical protein